MFDQVAHFRTLLEQKGVSSDLLQEFYDSGLIADLLEVRKPKSLYREAVRKALGLKPLTPLLLEPVGTVTIGATIESFVAREKFVVDTSQKAKVKIAWLGGNFQEWLLGKTEALSLEETLRYAKLTSAALDSEIRKEIGAEREETTLSNIWSLMERQKNGKPGALLVNGQANIFYVRDAGGTLRAVYVCWYAPVDSLYVSAYSVEDRSGWSDGSRVFSRNS